MTILCKFETCIMLFRVSMETLQILPTQDSPTASPLQTPLLPLLFSPSAQTAARSQPALWTTRLWQLTCTDSLWLSAMRGRQPPWPLLAQWLSTSGWAYGWHPDMHSLQIHANSHIKIPLLRHALCLLCSLSALQDSNDNAPRFGQSVYRSSINENHMVNSSIGITVIATDAETHHNISYFLDTNPPMSDWAFFHVGRTSGAITLNQAVDYDPPSMHRELSFRVRVWTCAQ